MRKLLRSIASVAVVATVASGAAVMGFAGSASASGPPPWEPGPQVGALLFYNAAGQQVTGGSLSAQPSTAYAQGTATLRSGDTKATLYGYLPVDGETPGQWSGEALSASTTFPNASAPSALASSPLPLVTGGSTDESIATLEADYPNTDTSTTDGYANMYVLRLKTSATGLGATTTYDSVDIEVNNTAGTWSVVYPAPTLTATTTTLTTVPSSPQVSGTSVALDATVSPSAPGTVQFEYGTGTPTLIGSPVTVSGGTATISTSTLPVGTDPLSAVFTPAAFSAYGGSTGTTSFTVSPAPAAGTTTALGINPSSAAADTAVTLTAAVTNTSTSAALASGAGTVDFFDNGTSTSDTITGGQSLGTVSLGTGGIATLPYSLFAVGAHNIVAEFLPANTAVYNSSISLVVLFTATAPQYTPDLQTVVVGIPAGTLTITTPYGPTNPFNLGTAALNPGQTSFDASAPFGSSSSPTAGVTITDTRAGDLPWTASAEASNFSDGATPTPDLINAQNLGFTGVTPEYITGNALQAGDVTVYQLPNTGAPFAPGASGTAGLGGQAQEFASATAGEGSVNVIGILTLTAPTSTPAGTYTATLTFTII